MHWWGGGEAPSVRSHSLGKGLTKTKIIIILGPYIAIMATGDLKLMEPPEANLETTG